jgi:protein FAM98B
MVLLQGLDLSSALRTLEAAGGRSASAVLGGWSDLPATGMAEREAEVLDRLAAFGAEADSLTQAHLSAAAIDKPLREAGAFLGERVPALADAAHAPNPGELASAGAALSRACASDTDAAAGRFDAALVALASAATGVAATTRLDALDAILSFLEAASLLATASSSSSRSASSETAELDSSADGNVRNVTEELRVAARILGAEEHPTASETLDSLETKVNEALNDAPEGHLDRILGDDCASALSQHDRQALQRVDDALCNEYAVRREMLIRRAEVTTASFLWSPRVRGTRQDGVRKEIDTSIAQMSCTPRVGADDAFDARNGALAFAARRTSTGDADTLRSAVKSVRIGAVPDRGGRTDVTRQGALPAFQERQVTKGDVVGGGGGRGRGDGSRRGGRGAGGGRTKQKQSADGDSAVPGGGGRKRKQQDAAVRW